VTFGVGDERWRAGMRLGRDFWKVLMGRGGKEALWEDRGVDVAGV